MLLIAIKKESYSLKLCLLFYFGVTVPLFAQNDRPDAVENPASSLMLEGKWVPDDPHNISFANLPRIASEHAIISDVRDTKGVNQHCYLIHHNDRFWAMWSDGPSREDKTGQRVAWATSPDGLDWSEKRFITPYPPTSGPDSPYYNTRSDKGFRYISRGFWKINGKLLALVSLDEAAGFFGPGLELQAFQWDETKQTWFDRGVIVDNAINNFPPKRLPDGEWAMSRRPYNYKKTGVWFLIGGTDAIDQWDSHRILGPDAPLAAEEPYWWELPDGNLVALFRDNRKSGYLFRAFSTDNGRTWTKTVPTNFPDARSKFNGVELEDGRYVLVSNPNPEKRDPMTLSVTGKDRLVFRKMVYLVGGRWVDYPHIIRDGNHLLIAHTGNKEMIEVHKVRISDLDAIVMPDDPLVNQPVDEDPFPNQSSKVESGGKSQ
ncbi:hypothetical protein GF407_09235 [candidate division KSB1 bacterium]|nr:hypothetical protein [candidate division KSB1 bacterium]